MSDCDVCIGGDYDEGESCELFNSRVIVARKDHLCCECKEPIRKGDSYHFERGKWEGEFSSFKTCRECAEIRTIFSCGGGFLYRSLWDQMREIAFPVLTTAAKCFTQLSCTAKQKTLDRWRHWKFQGGR